MPKVQVPALFVALSVVAAGAYLLSNSPQRASAAAQASGSDGLGVARAEILSPPTLHADEPRLRAEDQTIAIAQLQARVQTLESIIDRQAAELDATDAGFLRSLGVEPEGMEPGVRGHVADAARFLRDVEGADPERLRGFAGEYAFAYAAHRRKMAELRANGDFAGEDLWKRTHYGTRVPQMLGRLFPNDDGEALAALQVRLGLPIR